MEKIDKDSDEIFKLAFFYVTSREEELETFITKNPEFKEIVLSLENAYSASISEIFKYHFLQWKEELDNPNYNFKAIKKEIDHTIKDVQPQTNFEEEIVYCAAKHAILMTCATGLNGAHAFQLESKTEIHISPDRFFHVLFGHYYRFTSILLSDRGKSLFDDEYYAFPFRLKAILVEVDNHTPICDDHEVIEVLINNEYYRIVLRKDNKEPEQVNIYNLTTFYKIDKEININAVKKKKHIVLKNITLLE